LPRFPSPAAMRTDGFPVRNVELGWQEQAAAAAENTYMRRAPHSLQARLLLEAWRRDHNEARPHSPPHSGLTLSEALIRAVGDWLRDPTDAQIVWA